MSLIRPLITFFLFQEMPRNYTRVKTTKYTIYRNDDSRIIHAIEAMEQGMTLRMAANQFGINHMKLFRFKRREHMKKVGRPNAMGEDFENVLVSKILKCAEWGYPLDTLDLRYFVKHYLDSKNVTVQRFRNNLPGMEWARSFLKRHKSVLSVRLIPNIKNARADISPQTVNRYFDHLANSLVNVPPENIFNYDETNFSDTPGVKAFITKKEMKRPERVMNSTKSAFSVMFCGNATGEVLPPYVVYKSQHMWSSWIYDGIEGARYNRSKSGWFDACCFRDWFFSLALPALRRKEGPKALIGDNLSSHLSVEIVSACEENDIRFVFLPPNSTHLTQPLDIAYFAPLKRVWRQTLTEWKQGPGRNSPSIPKDELPKLIKDTMEKLFNGNGSQNMVSGFEKAGIVPLNRQRILDQLPEDQNNGEDLNDSLVEFLRSMRYKPERPRKHSSNKRLNVEPGRSVTANDIDFVASSPQCSRTDAPNFDISSVVNNESTLESVEDGEDSENSEMSLDHEDLPKMMGVGEISTGTLCEGDWVLVKLTSMLRSNITRHFLGEVKEILENDGVKVKFVKRYRDEKNQFTFPIKDDIADFEYDQIVGKVSPPEKLRRDVLRFNVNCDEW